jgi:resuscitation-promoting factor RpfA
MRWGGCEKRWRESAMAESDDRDLAAADSDALWADHVDDADHADVRAAYRSASVGDEPSAALDAAILAASRKAVNAGPASADRPARFLSRLTVPLSAAAVMVLATSLSFLVYEERGTPSAPESSRVVSAPVPDAATGRSAAPLSAAPADGAISESARGASKSEGAAALPRVRRAPMPADAESPGPAPEVPAVAAPAPSSPATVPESAAPTAGPPPGLMTDELVRQDQTASAREESAAVAADRAAGAGTERSARATAPGAKRLASPAQASASQEASPGGRRAMRDPGAESTPSEWIARVRALVAAGRIEAARAEVARLRCRYPDVTLPADLPAPEAGMTCPAAPKEGLSDLR